MVIVQSQQILELLKLGRIQARQMGLIEAFQDQIQFQQAAAAMPADAVEFRHGRSDAPIPCA